jgi:protein subunit release factor B
MEIRPEDIEEKFIRSRGKGGQNVNKVATCVRLKHLPTGTTIKCEVYRTQRKNRELAMKLLIEKLEKKETARLKKILSDKEKLKRQKRKRPKALQEKILQDKKQNSEKKELRKKLRLSEE